MDIVNPNLSDACDRFLDAPPDLAAVSPSTVAQFASPYTNIGTAGDLSRWRGGRQSVCPLTVGLCPGYNAFATARLRALAAYVGAPVQPDPQCKSNVQIIFMNNPQDGMSDGIVFNADVALVRLDALLVWPQITQNYVHHDTTGTRLAGGSGSGIGMAILIVDISNVTGHTIGPIADYLAMLTLYVAQSPDHSLSRDAIQAQYDAPVQSSLETSDFLISLPGYPNRITTLLTP